MHRASGATGGRVQGADQDEGTLLRPSAWLAHLQLLATLPYPVDVLTPTVLYTLRRGLRADYGTFTPLEPRTLSSGAIYAERFSPAVMGWLCAARQTAQATHSTEMMVRSDGESRRVLCLAPGYEDNPLYRHILQPLGTRWSMTAPLLDATGQAHGLLYLHRGAAHGPFSEAEQRLLRRARDVLQPLAQRHAGALLDDEPVTRLSVRQASLVLDGNGRFMGMGDGAREMLYRCAAPLPGASAWLAPNVDALPAPVLDDVLIALHAARHRAPAPRFAPRRLRGQAGDYEFRVEWMGETAGGADATAVVHLRHLEPADITLARRLSRWKLSPQERRLLITSVRHPHPHVLAERLGVSLHTLKSYSKEMIRRHGFASRQDMVNAVLQRAVVNDGLALC
ncbi:GAF domain-containing protein [Ottowia sp.]|uniref:helix-turn-helix transcriptional regulator n=1 Tax=Ottowia sp. TaxID=1898956 RepID=UPI002B7FADE8|nr:GAF domain-containing protein [Ottowia sp.]HOB66685.1 GAF domain-containing protein [Ottowia sp.]HPZ58697.1 GAF domain-containing protein [Ottowia sp.]HQD47074.1 GAF domain-containing protein [Ottowia sp.]